MEWYTKSFDNCILDEDPECAFNSSEYTFSRAIPYFCGQDPRCLYEIKMPHLFASDSVTIGFFFLLCYLGFHAAGGHCNELNSLLNTNTQWWEFWTRWTRRYKSSSLTFHASLLALRRSTTAEVNETVESHNWFLMAKTIFCFRLRPAAWKPLH